eukprot:10016302-Heterocapsa_arctica.AAC.1
MLSMVSAWRDRWEGETIVVLFTAPRMSLEPTWHHVGYLSLAGLSNGARTSSARRNSIRSS